MQLDPGKSFDGGEKDREACLVVLSGTADVTLGELSFDNVGGRESVFDDVAPGAVFVPAGSLLSSDGT